MFFFLRKKLDFLPNKLSKYSIRRFSVGTASILVGATLLFGIGNEADAAGNTHIQSTSEEVTDNNTASVASTTEETTNNEVTNEKPSKEEATSNEVTNEDSSVDEASTNDSTSNPDLNPKVLNDSVQEFDNNQSSDSQDRNVAYATPIGTTTNRSVQLRSRVAVNRSQAQQQGKNVNDSIKVTSVNTDKNYVEPNNGQGFSADISFEVDGKVNKGNYFTVDMPEYADFNGIADYKAANNKLYPTINDGNQVVANGVYDTQTKKLVYTFTDYVNKKDNIKGNFEIPQFIDRANAKTSGNYDLNYNIAGNTVTKPMEVEYNNYNDSHVVANTSSLITKADLFNVGSHDYTQYIYVNPKSEDSYNTRLTIQGYQEDVNDSSTLLNPDDTKIEILDAKSSDNIAPSFHINDEDFENVTDNFGINQIGDKKAQIDFGHIDPPYIVKVTSKIDPNSSQDLRTRVIMENENAEGTTDFYAHDNTVERLGANGVATGNEKLYNLGDYVWEDTNKNGIQDEDEHGIEGVEVSLTRPNGTVETTTTNSEGKYEFNNLQNGDYVINFKTPAGYTPTKAYEGNSFEVDSNGLSTVGTIKDADNWTLDSGFYKTPSKYSLGDYVWYDSNKDGYQDYDEKGIKGVKVTLKDNEGNILKTTETDENGKYRFDNLDSGEYTVHFDKPEGLTQTSTNSDNDDAKDADGEDVHVTITDHDDFSIDNGYFEDSESDSSSDSESTSESDSESHSDSELPDTGEEDNHQGLIGGMLAAFGGLTLLGRRRKKEEK